MEAIILYAKHFPSVNVSSKDFNKGVKAKIGFSIDFFPQNII